MKHGKGSVFLLSDERSAKVNPELCDPKCLPVISLGTDATLVANYRRGLLVTRPGTGLLTI